MHCERSSGKQQGNFWGGSGKVWEVQGLTRSSGKSGSLPATRQNFSGPQKVRKAPDAFNFLRHIPKPIWSVRPKCSHRCVSLKETSLKPLPILKHTTKHFPEQTAMSTKWFKPYRDLNCSGASPKNRESILKWGLSNGGLGYLSSIVRNCLQLSSFCDENPLTKAPKRPQMCTIADDCARVP